MTRGRHRMRLRRRTTFLVGTARPFADAREAMLMRISRRQGSNVLGVQTCAGGPSRVGAPIAVSASTLFEASLVLSRKTATAFSAAVRSISSRCPATKLSSCSRFSRTSTPHISRMADTISCDRSADVTGHFTVRWDTGQTGWHSQITPLARGHASTAKDRAPRRHTVHLPTMVLAAGGMPAAFHCAIV